MHNLAILLYIAATLLVCVVAPPTRTVTPSPPPPGPPFETPCKGGIENLDACLSAMNIDEKIGQMAQVAHNFLGQTPDDIATYALGSLLSGGGGGPNGAGGTATQWADMIDKYQTIAMTKTRLKIPLLYGVDAVHGHNNVFNATIFPHNIGLGAANDAALVKEIQQITRKEMLATGARWTFAPCIAVARDDRWGRTYESFSEDPTIVSTLGTAAVEGFQGTDLATNVLATVKHYVADGGAVFGTGSGGYLIDQGNVNNLSDQQIKDIHLYPYRAPITDANAGSVMVSYSSINGIKMHNNTDWLNILRTDVGFDKLIVSDWKGVNQISSDYAYALRRAINSGIDMIMIPQDYKTFVSTVKAENAAGRITTATIDAAVRRILTAKFNLNLFNNYLADRTLLESVGSKAHRDVARKAVSKSLVLLQNRNNVLPLVSNPTTPYKIMVAGKSANNIGYQCGGWTITWQGNSGATTVGTTILQGIKDVAATVAPGKITVDYISNAKGSYSGYDVGIAVVGELPYAEGQGDSSTLAMYNTPDVDTIKTLCAKVNKCLVLLVSGRPLIIQPYLSLADAWVAAWLPGTEGAGIADVLFNQMPFTGKLPVTWPDSVSQEPINTGANPPAVSFPFGHGLVYP